MQLSVHWGQRLVTEALGLDMPKSYVPMHAITTDAKAPWTTGASWTPQALRREEEQEEEEDPASVSPTSSGHCCTVSALAYALPGCGNSSPG